MLERLRFARYALKFERAFKTDQWDDVKACFHPEAIYALAGSGPKYDGEAHGPEAIIALFKRMLDETDRKFDSRRPGLNGLPRVRKGELMVPWRAKYKLGEQAIVLHGISHCRFEGNQIIALDDTMEPEECRRWLELARTKAAVASA
jgi:hypothetical protein